MSHGPYRVTAHFLSNPTAGPRRWRAMRCEGHRPIWLMDGYSPRTIVKILEYDWDIYDIYWETMKDSDIFWMGQVSANYHILGDRDLPAMTCGMGIVRHDYTPAKQDIVKRGNNQATLASTWEWWRGWKHHSGSGYKNCNIFTVASLEMFTIYFRKGSLSQNTVSSGWWLVHYYNLARMDLTTRHGCFFCLVPKFAMISERNRQFHGGANILFRKSPRLLIACINRHA